MFKFSNKNKALINLLLLLLITSCSPKLRVENHMQDPNSEALQIVLNSSDSIDSNIYWTNELLSQNYKETPLEELFVFLNGYYGEKNGINIGAKHVLSCYSQEITLQDYSIVKNSDLSGIEMFGDETQGLCGEENSLHNFPDGASCTIEVRYSKLISTVTVYYASTDVDFVRNVTNKILSTVNDKIVKSSYCK